MCRAPFNTLLKAASVQPRRVTGQIRSSVTERVVKLLVNKANVLSSGVHGMNLEAAPVPKRDKWWLHRPFSWTELRTT